MADDNTVGQQDQTTTEGDPGAGEVQKGTNLASLSPEDRAALLAEFQDMQARIAAQQPTGVQGNLSPEQVVEQRQQYGYYCPGCGKTSKYPKECRGTGAAPHPPIEVVSTDELSGNPSGHTAAPASLG